MSRVGVGVHGGYPMAGGSSASSLCSVPSTSARNWTSSRGTTRRWSWGWRAPTNAPTLPWPCSWHGPGCSSAAAGVRWGDGDGDVRPRCVPQGLSRVPVPPGLGELKEVPSGTELVGRLVPLAPTFRPTDAMIQGAVWLCQAAPPLPLLSCCRARRGDTTPGPRPVLPVLEGTAWLPAPHLIPAGVPVLEGHLGVPAMPCVPPTLLPGLRDTEWLGRTQVLPHGPVTWYLDGAHTTSSIQACVRWFRQAALNQDKPHE